MTADGCAGYRGVWMRIGGGPMGVVEALGVGREYGAGPGSDMLSRCRLGSGELLQGDINDTTFIRSWNIRVVSAWSRGERRPSRRGLRRHPPRPKSEVETAGSDGRRK